jgi:hypothetical protein
MALHSKQILLASLLLAACGPAADPRGSLTLKVSPASVVADGTNAVLIELDGSPVGSVTVRTNRGGFEGFGRIVTYTESRFPFTALLVTCDSRVDTTCAGLALVEATDQSLASARSQVSFQQAP